MPIRTEGEPASTKQRPRSTTKALALLLLVFLVAGLTAGWVLASRKDGLLIGSWSVEVVGWPADPDLAEAAAGIHHVNLPGTAEVWYLPAFSKRMLIIHWLTADGRPLKNSTP